MRASALHRSTLWSEQTFRKAACAMQIWIAGILALSAFWCFVSLLAISRLERRLPSEMQEQLEFHTAFSGLWPKAQGAAAGAALARTAHLCVPLMSGVCRSIPISALELTCA